MNDDVFPLINIFSSFEGKILWLLDKNSLITLFVITPTRFFFDSIYLCTQMNPFGGMFLCVEGNKN